MISKNGQGLNKFLYDSFTDQIQIVDFQCLKILTLEKN